MHSEMKLLPEHRRALYMSGCRRGPLQCLRSFLSRIRLDKLQCSEHHNTYLKRKKFYRRVVSQTNLIAF